jgi:FtsZ-interacting cell division protein YlmF
MESFWGRALVYLGLKEEPEDQVDWEVLEAADSTGPSLPARTAGAERPRQAGAAVAGHVRPTEAPSSNVRALHNPSDLQVERTAVVQVRVFDDVESIGSRYRQRQPVLFDVSASASDVARRTVDFVSGLTYASRGRLTKVAPRVFLLVPDGVRITRDEQRRLSTLGYEVGDEVVG